MDAKIEEWQKLVRQEGEASGSKHDGVASRLASAALELYELVLEHAEKRLSKPQARRLQRDRGYFILWCDGFGVTSSDLDGVLGDSKWLRHSTYRLLISICRLLADSELDTCLGATDVC